MSLKALRICSRVSSLTNLSSSLSSSSSSSSSSSKASILILRRGFSDSYSGDSITYSGGHASSGQGGFYGSGGARVAKSSPAHHPEAIARESDIRELSLIMAEVDTLESELVSLGNVVTGRTIEIKSRIKKTISNPKVREMLTRLEIKGEPVWGLSSRERDMVRLAKKRYLTS